MRVCLRINIPVAREDSTIKAWSAWDATINASFRLGRRRRWFRPSERTMCSPKLPPASTSNQAECMVSLPSLTVIRMILTVVPVEIAVALWLMQHSRGGPTPWHDDGCRAVEVGALGTWSNGRESRIFIDFHQIHHRHRTRTPSPSTSQQHLHMCRGRRISP